MSFKPILAKEPNKRAFLNSIKTNVAKVGIEPKKDFEKTTQTWDNKPTFNVKVTGFTDYIELFVGVESNWRKGKKATPEDIYMFVSRGTSERHALMSPDFSPKTKKGFIGSMAGRGGVVRVNKNIKLPGIDSRDFEETITKKNKSYINKSFQKILYEAAKVSNWTL